jgi:tRNA (cmo5U34)-methyltransferase
MTLTPSSWQDGETARRFLDERRAAIPYGVDQIQLLLRLVRHYRDAPRQVLDLGCGDGVLARAVLTCHPTATAVLLDHSGPMLERAAAAMKPFADRCRLVRADLREPLPFPDDAFDLVVSGFAIHHLTDGRKRSLYDEVLARLESGGLFVNIEHVASASPSGEKLFDAVYVDRLAERTGRPREQVEAEYLNRPDRADNILAPVGAQLAWLREAGFTHVDCWFKFLELAVFGGARE